MTDYELLSIMLTILAIITSILVAYINKKSNRQPDKLTITF